MLRALMTSALLISSLSGCDFLDELLETENAGPELTAAALSGKVLLFTNPDPDPSIGEHGTWDYTFRNSSAVGCNSQGSYTSDGWEVMDANTIRIYFGQHWEQYRMDSMQGSLSDISLKGTFRLTSSVPGNEVDGRFSQAATGRYGECR
ncbi:MAG: hypothetical protein ACE5GJ_14770 [Gemmatimonadota bacterium]